jgi:hypothetical protein
MMMVVQLRERKGQRKKGGETDAKLTISNTYLIRKKKSSLMIECLKCVTASAFVIGQLICI